MYTVIIRSLCIDASAIDMPRRAHSVERTLKVNGNVCMFVTREEAVAAATREGERVYLKGNSQFAAVVPEANAKATRVRGTSIVRTRERVFQWRSGYAAIESLT